MWGSRCLLQRLQLTASQPGVHDELGLLCLVIGSMVIREHGDTGLTAGAGIAEAGVGAVAAAEEMGEAAGAATGAVRVAEANQT